VSGPAKVAIVVAMAKEGRVIGKDGGLPWRIPGDMRFFKSITLGKPIIMGRKTFESIGKPLPGRTNIVITRDTNWSADGARVCHTIEDALVLARKIAARDDAAHICIIGGAEIYALALPLTDVIFLTEVAGAVEGDTTLSAFDMSEWEEVNRLPIPDDARATHKAELVELVRR